MIKNQRYDSRSISASAGCGKTEVMARRMLGMFLSSANEPEKIFRSTLAVTFSRSGAKEIYSRVLELIFEALLYDSINDLNEKLQKLDFNLPPVHRETLLVLLRKLIFSSNERI